MNRGHAPPIGHLAVFKFPLTIIMHFKKERHDFASASPHLTRPKANPESSFKPLLWHPACDDTKVQMLVQAISVKRQLCDHIYTSFVEGIICPTSKFAIIPK